MQCRFIEKCPPVCLEMWFISSPQWKISDSVYSAALISWNLLQFTLPLSINKQQRSCHCHSTPIRAADPITLLFARPTYKCVRSIWIKCAIWIAFFWRKHKKLINWYKRWTNKIDKNNCWFFWVFAPVAANVVNCHPPPCSSWPLLGPFDNNKKKMRLHGIDFSGNN